MTADSHSIPGYSERLRPDAGDSAIGDATLVADICMGGRYRSVDLQCAERRILAGCVYHGASRRISGVFRGRRYCHRICCRAGCSGVSVW